MVLSFGLFFIGCEGDQNGRMPDDIKDANTGLLVINKTASDPFINLSEPADYKVEVKVDQLFKGDFNKIDVVVVLNGDYKKQYVVESVTTVPTTLTITGQDLVDAIPELASAGDIEEGDIFNLFTSIELTDGTYLPGYTILGSLTAGPSLRNVMNSQKGGVANYLITVPCAFDINDYLGAVNISEYWAPDQADYPGEIIIDPAYTGTKIGLKVRGIWDGTWELKLELSDYDYTVIGLPASQVMAASVFGYSTPTWSQMAGSINTCAKSMTVNVGRFCVSVGCFGGMPIVYTFTKATPTKKSAGSLRDIQIPLRPTRTVE